MPIITTENGQVLQQIHIPAEIFFKYVPLKTLFNMIRINTQFAEEINDLLQHMIISPNQHSPVTVHQLNFSATLPPLQFSPLQEIAFTSPYATEHYTISQRLSLAWAYDQMNLNALSHPAGTFITTPQINYLMDPAKYTNPMHAPAGMLATSLLEKLASLGFTLRECNKIPYIIRKILASNQLIINREEIEFMISPENQPSLLDCNLIKNIQHILNISPTIQAMPAGAMFESKLIKIRLSELCKLQQQDGDRLNYLASWIEQYLKAANLYQRQPGEQDPTMQPTAMPDMNPPKLYVDQYTSARIIEDIQNVINLLQSPLLTPEIINQSKEQNFNLTMLQKEQAKQQLLMFSSISRNSGANENLQAITQDQPNRVVNNGCRQRCIIS